MFGIISRIYPMNLAVMRLVLMYIGKSLIGKKTKVL